MSNGASRPRIQNEHKFTIFIEFGEHKLVMVRVLLIAVIIIKQKLNLMDPEPLLIC